MNKLQKISEKISAVTKAKTPVVAKYVIEDNSVQAELRLRACWQIYYPVDSIKYPKNLAGDDNESWPAMRGIARKIYLASTLYQGEGKTVLPANSKTKTGAEKRVDAKNNWLMDTGNNFLTDYKKAINKRLLATTKKKISGLQAEQMRLLPLMRESNSRYLQQRKTEKIAKNEQNAAAIKSGKFWEADKETIKGYFSPPFSRNYLADVSERWRAALFTECKSSGWKSSNGWRHKLIGTGRGYLCGIDDNGDEWGYNCEVDTYDRYGTPSIEGSVEDAMCELFAIGLADLKKCYRQGDLLFCPCVIPAGIELEMCDSWTPRESHEIMGHNLQHNGRYFSADSELRVEHTSHCEVVLPAGEYRLYPLQVMDAD